VHPVPTRNKPLIDQLLSKNYSPERIILFLLQPTLNIDEKLSQTVKNALGKLEKSRGRFERLKKSS